LKNFGGFFDFAAKRARAEAIEQELARPEVWGDLERSRDLRREQARIGADVTGLAELGGKIAELRELAALCLESPDDALAAEVAAETAQIQKRVDEWERRRIFSKPGDAADCFIDIQAGSGGTEAQDWAAMLRRMYLRFCERAGFQSELLEESPGEVAGIKSATIKVSAPYAYGNLRTETGIHRLVRKSPFDANHRRHTSFASVFVYPAADDAIEIEINPADLRIDTYRSSGAGGQHVNTTDSAVRITHLPSGAVAQCQNDRSQHKNRAEAMRLLRAKLYRMELDRRDAEKKKQEEAKSDIGWGHQIRSYVLDQSRIKDLRTSHESGAPRNVLDGDLAAFIDASLKAGL
jgi:peptide chain release factor 2